MKRFNGVIYSLLMHIIAFYVTRVHRPEDLEMICKSTPNSARHLVIAAFLFLATSGIHGPVSAESRRPPPDAPIDHGALSGPPVMAIVSMKDQRISLYDAAGGAMRARISSGRFDYETPVGTYSILQKNKEHYSNVYDDAAMPFMQRITWSGVSLHEGDLPGYPASHGCVRLPHSFAEQIFPLTKIGMRVIIARDNVAPVGVTHPLLLKPAALAQSMDQSMAATPTAYEDLGTQQQSGSVFQADVRNSSQRQAEMDALKAIATELASKAELTKAPVEDLKSLSADKTKQRDAAAKILRAADKVKRIADDKSARAGRDLANAKDPAKLKKWEIAKTKADAAVVTATAKLTKVTAEAATVANGVKAQIFTNDRQRNKAERTVRTAERAVRDAQRAERNAISQAARAGQDLAAAQSPTRYKKQEDAVAKAATAATAAAQKHADATAVHQSAVAELQQTTQDLAAAGAVMDAAVVAAREAERKTFPVSIFISLKTQRIYVRQGHEPILDVPVTISEPSKPIGTHVFTATDYDNGGADLRWTAVSLSRRPPGQVAELSNKSQRKSDIGAEPYETNATIAAAALDRLTIPPEIVARVSASIWPGSSLIVSDEAASKETGNSTDFIVLMSGEPQGGIKRRPKPAPVPFYNSYSSSYGSSYGTGSYLYYDRYGRPIRIQQRQKPKPIFNWW